MEADFLYLNGPLCPSNPPAAGAAPGTGPLPRLWIGILLLVAASDVLFYGQAAGLSVAIMGALLLAVLVWNRRAMRWDVPRVAGLLLLMASIVQAAVETGFSNGVVLACLLSAAMIDGEAERAGLRAAVLPLALAAWLRSLGRWITFFDAAAGTLDQTTRRGVGRNAIRSLRVVLPGLAVLLPFWLLFFTGNALMAKNFSDGFDLLASWVRWLHFPTAGRVVFWLLSATAALTFLWPKLADGTIRRHSRPWPTFQAPTDAAFARGRTWFMLGALNLLFFWANSLDAVFLWFNTRLPAGVTYSGFVHQGVLALTTATLLSAATLTLLLQQDPEVSAHPATRTLAYAWIAQNILLIASVALRLKLYVEAYDLTVQRCGVWCFLGLVALGFVLLAKRIARHKSLNWLILTNGAAVFALFFVLQFVDLNGIVARYNTARWLDHRSATIDVRYLQSLGPAAWPSLLRISQAAGPSEEQAAARRALHAEEAAHGSPRPWRSWQWREEALRKEVFPTAAGGAREYP